MNFLLDENFPKAATIEYNLKIEAGNKKRVKE
jgi:hypothetical protein